MEDNFGIIPQGSSEDNRHHTSKLSWSGALVTDDLGGERKKAGGLRELSKQDMQVPAHRGESIPEARVTEMVKDPRKKEWNIDSVWYNYCTCSLHNNDINLCHTYWMYFPKIPVGFLILVIFWCTDLFCVYTEEFLIIVSLQRRDNINLAYQYLPRGLTHPRWWINTH